MTDQQFERIINDSELFDHLHEIASDESKMEEFSNKNEENHQKFCELLDDYAITEDDEDTECEVCAGEISSECSVNLNLAKLENELRFSQIILLPAAFSFVLAGIFIWHMIPTLFGVFLFIVNEIVYKQAINSFLHNCHKPHHD